MTFLEAMPVCLYLRPLNATHMLIFLIGLPGGGKSHIGPGIARALNMLYIDTDKEIEKEQDSPIAEIFVQEGEKAFREMETQVLKDCLQETHAVIATGGGMPCHSGNMDAMLKAGLVVRLQPPMEEMANRILKEGTENRPLFAGADTTDRVTARLKELLAEREPFYGRAHMTIQNPDFVADFVKKIAVFA